jgi:hypothetical protein
MRLGVAATTTGQSTPDGRPPRLTVARSETTRRPFETPADAKAKAAAAVESDDREVSVMRRQSPRKLSRAPITLTPQVTPLDRRSARVPDSVDGDSSPSVPRKRTLPYQAPFIAPPTSLAPSAKRMRQRAAEQGPSSRWVQDLPPVPVPQGSRYSSKVATQLDAAIDVAREAVADQIKRSGDKHWLAQFQQEIDDEFEQLRAQLDQTTAVTRRLQQLQQEISRERVSTVEATREQASVEAKLNDAKAELEQRRAVVERKVQLTAWLRQLQALREQAVNAPPADLAHTVAPNAAFDAINTARSARLAAAQRRATRVATLVPAAPIATPTRRKK